MGSQNTITLLYFLSEYERDKGQQMKVLSLAGVIIIVSEVHGLSNLKTLKKQGSKSEYYNIAH